MSDTPAMTGLRVAIMTDETGWHTTRLKRAFRARGLVRAAVLLPWAIPPVVAALLARFVFEAPWGAVDTALMSLGIVREPPVWLAGPRAV